MKNDPIVKAIVAARALLVGAYLRDHLVPKWGRGYEIMKKK